MNSNKHIEYYNLLAQKLSNTGTVTQDTTYGRKVSDYDMIYVNVGKSNTYSRGTMLIPVNIFRKGMTMYVFYTYGGQTKEVDITFVSDTKISVNNQFANDYDSVWVYGLGLSPTRTLD